MKLPAQFKFVFLTLVISVQMMQGVSPVTAQVQQGKDDNQDQVRSLKISIYGSLLAGSDRSIAESATKPLVNKLEDELGNPFPFELTIADGSDLSDLEKFGDKLKNGEVHLGVIWGTEYGWLKKHSGANLKSLVVISVGGDSTNSSVASTQSRLYVRKDGAFKSLNDFSGKEIRLLEFQGNTLDDRNYRKKLSKSGVNFRIETENRIPVGDAIDAVLNGNDADCVILNGYTHRNFDNAYPAIAKQLEHIDSSNEYPLPALVGIPDRINQLRPRLWDELQSKFISIHSTSEGEQLTEFWKFNRFILPTIAYESAVDSVTLDD